MGRSVPAQVWLVCAGAQLIYGSPTVLPNGTVVLNSSVVGGEPDPRNDGLGIQGATSIIVTDNVQTISGAVGWQIPALAWIFIPESVQLSSADAAFPNCFGFGLLTAGQTRGVARGNVTCIPCHGVTNVQIPDSVVSIGPGSFSQCLGMATIDVPPTAKIVTRGPTQNNDRDQGADTWKITLPSCLGFGVATSLSLQPAEPRQRSIPCYCGNSDQSVAIPSGVVVIAANALASCSPRSLTLPDSLTTIEPGAFDSMSHNVNMSTTVVLPDSVTTIDDGAFAKATGVHISSLPNSVTFLGAEAFENTAFGPGLNYSGRLTSISTYAFYSNNLVHISLLTDTITAIGTFAFGDNPNLISVILPDSITVIGGSAFMIDSSLASINIPSRLTFIGTSAFAQTALTDISLPVSTIQSVAFQSCTLLQQLVITSSTVSIGVGAFQGCTRLATATIPALATIGGSSFNGTACPASVFSPGANVCNCANGTCGPTSAPTTEPPTAAPTRTPTRTRPPTAVPTANPTSPTATPTTTPTSMPTMPPTAVPTYPPTAIPTATPTLPICATGGGNTCDLNSTDCAATEVAPGFLCTCKSGFTRIPHINNSCTVATTQSTALSNGEIAGIAVAAVIVVVCLGFVAIRSVRNLMIDKQLQRRVNDAEQELMWSHQTIDSLLAAWQIPHQDITFCNLLAEGTYGTVWKGLWGNQPVAIKMLKQPVDQEDDPEGAGLFRKECETLQTIKHPNLLIFYGAGTRTDNGHAYVVTEFMAVGSLRTYLLDKLNVISWGRRIQMALHIARGMAHLHSLGIVHRDLKSDNVLLSENLHAKVADFGTSRNVLSLAKPGARSALQDRGSFNPRASMTRAVGTLLWMAPEVFFGDVNYGPSVDVYSYGIILWELATRDTPWDELDVEDALELFSKLDAALRNEERPVIRPEVVLEQPEFVALTNECWSTDPTTRPSFEAVVNLLQERGRPSGTVPDIEDGDGWNQGSIAPLSVSEERGEWQGFGTQMDRSAPVGEARSRVYEDDMSETGPLISVGTTTM